jgi:hypothetical protein
MKELVPGYAFRGMLSNKGKEGCGKKSAGIVEMDDHGPDNQLKIKGLALK